MTRPVCRRCGLPMRFYRRFSEWTCTTPGGCFSRWPSTDEADAGEGGVPGSSPPPLQSTNQASRTGEEINGTRNGS
jgi:hypothetical protein